MSKLNPGPVVKHLPSIMRMDEYVSRYIRQREDKFYCYADSALRVWPTRWGSFDTLEQAEEFMKKGLVRESGTPRLGVSAGEEYTPDEVGKKLPYPDLKPCPFCGSSGRVMINGGWDDWDGTLQPLLTGYNIVCSCDNTPRGVHLCEVQPMTCGRIDLELAVRAWNLRVDP